MNSIPERDFVMQRIPFTFGYHHIEIILLTTMRTIFSCFIICLTIFLFSCSQNKSDKNKPIPQQNVPKRHSNFTFHTITASSYDAIKKSNGVQEGTYNGKTISTYDDSGILTEIKYYSSANELLYKESNDYDSTGRLRATKRVLPNGSSGLKIIPKYNEKGLRNEDDWYNPSGSLYCTIQMQHNESGAITESNTYNSEGTLIQRISSYSYNDSSEVKECVYFKPDGSVDHTLSYEYNNIDNEGHWRTNIILKNNIPAQIIKREIEYLVHYTY